MKNKKLGTANSSIDKYEKFYLPCLWLIGVLVFAPIFTKSFVNLDDNWFLMENPYITQFDIVGAFGNFYKGQYSPVVSLLIGGFYKIFGDNVVPYNFLSLFIHLINGSLCFILLKKLSNKSLLAFCVSLVFLIHPLQVESVAWSSAAFKMALFACPFLGGLIMYTKFIDTNKLKYYFLALVFMVIAVLIKEQAIMFTFCLFLIDYILQKPIFNVKGIVKKIPFLIVSIIGGIITLMASASFKDGSIKMIDFSFFEKIVAMSFSMFDYLYKILFPKNLSIFYPTPTLENINGIYILSLAVPILLMLAIYFFWSKDKKYQLFGILFLLINLALAFAIIIFNVRDTFVADRYLYVPIIGFYFSLFSIISEYAKQNKSVSNVLRYVFVGYVIILSFLSFNRVQVWENSEVLWSDAIRKYPEKVIVPYNSRGDYYAKQKQYEKALKDFNVAIKLSGKSSAKPHRNRGIVFMKMNKFDEGISDLSRAIQIDPKDVKSYSERSLAYFKQKKYDMALNDANIALGLDDKYINSYLDRAFIYSATNNHNMAIKDYTTYISYKSDNDKIYLYRGLEFAKLNQLPNALNDLNKAIEINSQDPSHYELRSQIYASMGEEVKSQADIAKVNLLRKK